MLRDQTLVEEQAKRGRGRRGNTAEVPSVLGSFGNQRASSRVCEDELPTVQLLEEPAEPALKVPRFAGRPYLLVLHLHSGRRRPGDFQSAMEDAAAGRPFWVLSLDVALHPTKGDLSSEHAIRHWESLIKEGWVIFVLAGPPCETWSVARGRPLGDGREGPRRLRSKALLWGLRCVTSEESVQLRLGNVLYQAALRIFTLCTALHVGMVLEHPAEPRWDYAAPSSWQLPEVLNLQGLPGVVRLDIDQCMFGLDSRKPTSLLTCHCTRLTHSLASRPSHGRCTHGPMGHRPTVGLDPEGRFHTASMKEYPSGLTTWLAEGVLEQWGGLLAPANPDMPAEVQDFYVPLEPYLDYEMARDFAPCSFERRRRH